jgi:hypothetical protein
MTEDKTCMRCGSTELVAGWAQSTGKVCFRPDKARFLIPKTADVPVHSIMCLECGTIELVGDVKKGRSLIKPIHAN